MHILDKPLDLPEQGADKVLSGASKVGRRDRGHAKNPVFSQFLLSDGTPLITSKSVCQQPAKPRERCPPRAFPGRSVSCVMLTQHLALRDLNSAGVLLRGRLRQRRAED